MTRRALLPLLLTGASLLAGCGGSDETGPPILPEEQRSAAEQHPLLLAEFGGAYEGPEAAYTREIGEKIAAAAGLGDQCTFTLVNSDVVNAFAVPGCYIYVTRGLMGIVNSEGELASVLAHEVGHIVGTHGRRQQKRSVLRELGVVAVAVLTGSERLTRLAGRAAEYFTLRYSRGQEYEADDLGIRYLVEAGYDPYAARDMLASLERQEQFLAETRGRDEARAIPEWALTHPLTANRVERAAEAAEATGLAPDALSENEAAYFDEVDGLLYGDDPEQGFVLGRRFAHPIMRIGFEAPPGFTLTNSPQAILIEGPQGLRGEFAGGPMPRGGLEAYVGALLEQLLGGAPAELGAAQPLLIHGVPALIVPVRVETGQGTAELSIAAYDAGDGGAYHFVMAGSPSGEVQQALASLFGSFHLLSDREVQSLRPRVIRTVTVGPGDTAETLAGRMAGANPAALFRMLNGLAPGEAPAAGEEVKIVTFAGR